MPRFLLHLMAIALLTSVSACAQPGPTTAEREDTITRQAEIRGIDRQERRLLIRGEEGNYVDMVVGPEVRNFDQLEIGDQITIEYYEAVALRMADESSSETPTGAVVTERAAEGEKPAGGAAQVVNLVVEFVSYDPETHLATFRTPDGQMGTVVVKPEMREFAAAREAGDKIDATITEAFAISVTKRQQ